MRVWRTLLILLIANNDQQGVEAIQLKDKQIEMDADVLRAQFLMQ